MECTIRWRKHDRMFGLRFADAVGQGARRALLEQCVARNAIQAGRSSPFTSWPAMRAGSTGSVVPFGRLVPEETAVRRDPAREKHDASTGAVVIDLFTRKRRTSSGSPSMQTTQWLEAIGFVIDADGNWRKTESCEAELARLRPTDICRT